MVNYGNGKIYKIVRLTDDVVVYVGSTTKHYLSSRLVEHKRMSKRCQNRRIYKSISENCGWENHAIILIELCNCNSKDELHRKEREFIVSLKPIGNIVIPMRTKKEWTHDNKEIIKEYKKEYYLENKENINKYANEYRIENIEKVKQNKKEYYLENKEKINRISKQYKVENKEKINQKIYCCCGRTYAHQSKSRHFKTKIHLNNIPKPVVNIL